MRQLLVASAAVAVALAAVSAQPAAEEEQLVTVQLEQVLEPMAAEFDLPDVLLPETVDVPETVATEACGVSPSELAEGAGEGAACTAVGRTPELTRFVQEGMVVSGRPVDAATIDEDLDRTPDQIAPDPALDETGPQLDEPTLEDAPEPPTTETSPGEAPEPPTTAISPDVNGDDPMQAAPSDIREPAGQLPDAGSDQ